MIFECKRNIFCLLFIFILIGCATKQEYIKANYPTLEDVYRRVNFVENTKGLSEDLKSLILRGSWKHGMSKNALIASLGQPYEVDEYGDLLYCHKSDKECEGGYKQRFSFENGKLTGWLPKYDNISH